MTQPIKPGAPTPPRPAGPSPTVRALPIYSNQTVTLGEAGSRCLYIGPPLTGKTTKMLTWPGVVFIQFDEERSVVDGSRTPIPVISVSDWGDWSGRILPAIKSRQRLQTLVSSIPGFESYTVRTVAIDSFTGMGEMCETHFRSLHTNTMRMYGDKLVALRQTKDDLFSICRPSASGTPLNLIGAVHERALTRSVKNAKGEFEEIIEAIIPSITGQFGERFLEYWAVILWCMKEVPAAADGELLKNKPVSYFCRTDPIDAHRSGVDRLGGGRLPRLPPRVSGSYPDLMKHWGLTQSSESANPTTKG